MQPELEQDRRQAMNAYFAAKVYSDTAALALKKDIERFITVRERPSWRDKVFNEDILRSIATLETAVAQEDAAFVAFAQLDEAYQNAEEEETPEEE